ncbi:IS3 family transposase [Caballeronia sp. LZ034LL]|uniref:IS3 family transposase n=1 Tax=Caballeronia sp. LZ034LL TaxID=3038567 RepID=UPI00285C3AD9|nr:IS3 family transposase [Caballeronia sp. LZ034LL]MDR5839460.1 IS3 family transposase [Caballeronia sp. LZ034LL]
MGRREFSEEFKREAAGLVLEHGYTVTKAAKAMGIGESALRRWIGNRRPVGGASVSAVESDNPEQFRIRELEKRVMELERERDILKKFHSLFRQGIGSRYEVIQQAEKAFPTEVVCRVVEVPRSSYYAWKARQRQENAARVGLVREVQAIHAQMRQSYGSRRMSKEMRRRGYAVGRERARRLMREGGVQAQTRRTHRYVKREQSAAIAENRLDRKFAVTVPNRFWAGDVTYISTQQGWMYLAVVLDLYSRRVVGWATSGSCDTFLVIRALQLALEIRRPDPGLMFHSDQGSNYASLAFQQFLSERAIVQSMSRKGNCWDNAVVERFFCSLKGECTGERAYRDHAEARADVLDYILKFYNPHRLHSAANHMPPAEFEEVKKVAV